MVSGVTFGYQWASGHCGGKSVNLSIAASPDQADVVSSLAKRWQDTAPEIDGRCARITVRSEVSAQVASSLTPQWKADSDDPRIDVWMPDSSVWIQSAGSRPDIASMVSGEQSTVASSPIVMALPEPMALALDWPDKLLSWSDLSSLNVSGVTWSKFGHPEWGHIQVGVGQPKASFAALATLLSVADANDDDTVTQPELNNALLLNRAVSTANASGGDFIENMKRVTNSGAGLKDSGAFPATEREVAAYDDSKPKVPLVAINPDEGTVMADYPYLVLKADWVDSPRQQIARNFLTYLESGNGQTAYGRAGFRAADQSTRYALGLNTDLGLGGQSTSTVRALPDIQTIDQTVGYWTALSRAANLLAVIDTSGSMADPAADGSGGTRLQVVQQALLQADALVSPKSDVGAWKFSTKLDGEKDYKEMVPIGPVGGFLPDGTPRRKALDKAVYSDLAPQGNTGLYDTMLAAYKVMQEKWEGGNKLNLLVIFTDGKNDDPGGITQAALIRQLKAVANPDRPVQVLIIGYGPDTDIKELTTITKAVGGSAYTAKTGADIQKVFLATLVGSPS
jgi:Ca-activated chloride channel family protein